MQTQDGADRGRPLVVTGDGELLDELLRIAGAAGVEVTVAVDALAAEVHWASAPLVVVGSDRVADLARHRLPRRMAVLLVGGPGWVGETTQPWSGADVLHAEHVLVLPDAQTWLVARLGEHAPGGPLVHPAPVVGVVAGSEGAGARTLASALATTARQRGLATLLIDADPRRGRVDLAGGRGADHGAEHAADHAADRLPEAGFGDPPAIVVGPEVAVASGGTLALLSFDGLDQASVPPDAMVAALRAARYGRDLVVVDLPRTFDVAGRLALTSADRCYLVVVAEIRACATATRVAAAARRHCPGLALVVQAAARGLRPGEVAEALDLPLAGVLPPEPWATGRDALARLSRRLLADIGARPGSASLAAPPVSGAEVDR